MFVSKFRYPAEFSNAFCTKFNDLCSRLRVLCSNSVQNQNVSKIEEPAAELLMIYSILPSNLNRGLKSPNSSQECVDRTLPN